MPPRFADKTDFIPPVIAGEAFDRLLADADCPADTRPFIVAAHFPTGACFRAGAYSASYFDLHEIGIRALVAPQFVEMAAAFAPLDIASAVAGRLTEQIVPLEHAWSKPLRLFIGAMIEASVGKTVLERAWFDGDAAAIEQLRDVLTAPPPNTTSAPEQAGSLHSLHAVLQMPFALWLRPYALPLTEALPDWLLELAQRQLSPLLPLLTFGFDAQEAAAASQTELLLLLAELNAAAPSNVLETALMLRTAERIRYLVQLDSAGRKQYISHILPIAAVLLIRRWLDGDHTLLDYADLGQFRDHAAITASRDNLFIRADQIAKNIPPGHFAGMSMPLAISEALLRCEARSGRGKAGLLYSSSEYLDDIVDPPPAPVGPPIVCGTGGVTPKAGWYEGLLPDWHPDHARFSLINERFVYRKEGQRMTGLGVEPREDEAWVVWTWRGEQFPK
jgi:hypothetical protein